MDALAITLACLALNVYHEARSEPIEGQLAVAYVTLNRANDSGKDVCDIVGEPHQFSWTTGNIIYLEHGWMLTPEARPTDKKAYQIALTMAEQALYKRLPDPTQGATHYHAEYVQPGWSRTKVQHYVIGKHKFYLD